MYTYLRIAASRMHALHVRIYIPIRTDYYATAGRQRPIGRPRRLTQSIRTDFQSCLKRPLNGNPFRSVPFNRPHRLGLHPLAFWICRGRAAPGRAISLLAKYEFPAGSSTRSAFTPLPCTARLAGFLLAESIRRSSEKVDKIGDRLFDLRL